MKLLSLLFLSSFFLLSCDDEPFTTNEDLLVVEGWIEPGEFPIVLVTKNLSFSLSGEDLKNKVVRWAKVTVSDGEKEIILTGFPNKNFNPPYMYTCSKMRGVVGHSYTLRVEYEDQVVTAKTTIPPPIPIDSFNVKKCTDSDTLYQIKAFFTDPLEEHNYYKFFTQVKKKESCFHSSFLGCFDDLSFEKSTVCASVYNGKYEKEEDFTPFFKIEDEVLIRFAQLNEPEYAFWSAYENAVNLSHDLFFPSHKSLPSNINGGIGFWCGYGSSIYKINIAKGTVTKCR
ncbi:MAG: DUF4249 domain-containing protein [Bacteroidaceae bacterium]